MYVPKNIIWTVLLLLSVDTGATNPAKSNASPVYEVINEQARIDDKIRQNSGSLPYGNPLAGNSKQNARLHAQNQQAMFNAERIRQHRAQLQRWAQMPHVDSYMRAYHDSQESHQLAVEQQQAGLRDRKAQNSEAKPKSRRNPNPKPETLRSGVKVIPDIIKITKSDAIIKAERNRNHRSYGSVEYLQYLQPKMYKAVYVSPAPTYDQGVTIKPNGNVGVTGQHTPDNEHKLLTEAVPSKTQYVYPKQYNQMQNYESAQDIAALNLLLKKQPQEQLLQLNALINSGKNGQEDGKGELETPIDLYFYTKNSPMQSLVQHYNQISTPVPQNYASAYIPEVKDHKPITEEIDDVEDPNKNQKVKSYGVQTILAPQIPEIETTTVKSNNYYKVEVASQTITSGHKPHDEPYRYYLKGQEGDQQKAITYIQPVKNYIPEEVTTESDQSERYLHHNAQHKGVQHLNGDGTGVSAYSEDNLQYAANYEFGYRVRDLSSGNEFGHQEEKVGGSTRGRYHVLLPDGRLQLVHYSAGPAGYRAHVSYDHLH